MKFKFMNCSFAVLLTLLVVSCAQSLEQRAINEAAGHAKRSQDAKAENNMRGYFTHAQRGLRVLFDFLQKEEPTNAVREKYIAINIDLGNTVLDTYEQDAQGKARILATYENIMRYIYTIKYDTTKTKGADGQEAVRVEKKELKDLSPETYTAYANFLARVAETFKKFETTREALPYMILAKEIDPNNAAIKQQFEQWKKDIAADALARAEVYFESIREAKIDEIPADPAIAAEYFTLVALKHDSTNQRAKELISKIRPRMLHTYSAYTRLLDFSGLTPKEIDRDIKQDVLMAFISFDRRGSSAAAEISIYNYSFNPIELRPEVFFLVDREGNRFRAKRTNHAREMPSKLLDMEWEERGGLWFDVPAGADIVKLVYDMERTTPDGTVERFFSEKYIK